ncbi:MAG TPA: SDR family oxidoreductase [Gaiellales bacterium]|nr:SDR family oxidoreductase [Gaiellales bacterium]
MAQRLDGRTALVTGSTSGIGRAIAIAFAAEGAHVAVSGRDDARGAATVAAIREAGGRADFVRADLGASADAARALAGEGTRALGGRVDVLVNNAGIFPSAPTAEVDQATFDSVIATNVRGPFFLVAALAPSMAERGSGVIINIGSWISTIGLSSGALYGASKGTLEALTRGWAAEFGRSGVRINAIAPGVTLTDGTAHLQDHTRAMVDATPAGRFGTPEDVAAAAVYLASDDASFMHGSTLLIDGGALTTRA